jgi:hypothetical protein
MVVIGAAIIGWLLVNYLFSRGKPKEDEEEGGDARDVHSTADVQRLPAPTRSPSAALDSDEGSAAGLSLEELGRHWHIILGVPNDATAAQIERAYHSKLAEYDAIRFSSEAPTSVKRSAEEHRERLIQAFEFIRPMRR